jgi:hypothetical protein
MMDDGEKAATMLAAFREVAEFVQRRMKDLEDVARTQPAPATDLEARLEALPWTEAASKKCFYTKNAPLQLVEAVRSVKGGVRGSAHHFTAAADSPTLFRFARKKGEAA